jgi:hypothetical protein
MGKDVYTLYSHHGDDLSKSVDEIEKDLINDKIGFEGPSPLPEAHSNVIRRVENSEPINNHELLWLKNANPHRLEYIISEFAAESVYGYEIRVPSRHTRTKDIISEKINSTEGIYYTRIASSETHHVPFSYDPNQDFKTEPDR